MAPLAPVGVAAIETQKTKPGGEKNNIGEDVEKLEPSMLLVSWKMVPLLWKTAWRLLTN